MARLFLRYHAEPHIAHAIEMWVEADADMEQLRQLGTALRAEMQSPAPEEPRIDTLLSEIDILSEKFPRVENEFSKSLGDAARYARTVVSAMLMVGSCVALILGLLVSYRLIVRVHDADEQYRHLFETASDAVVIAESETGVILDANIKLSELTGLPVSNLLGMDQRKLFGREIPTIPGASDLHTGDLVIRSVDDVSIPVEVRTSKGRLRGRRVDYSVVRDIRERRQMEETLQEAARMESVGRLAGGIAHDFNNLLTVISGYTSALKRITDGQAQHKVDQIRNASNRAAELVRQLLAFSRKQPLEFQSINLNSVIRRMEDMIRGMLSEQIDLVFDLAHSLGNVEADPHQIEQIILNLASNAKDAMPEKGRLIIQTWNDLELPGWVGLSVSDTGHGMDEATRRRIFEPFFTTKQLGKGTGLGLASVYGTVKQSQGQISVESEPGKGTSFRILLPGAARVRQNVSVSVDSGQSEGVETILLVEDDPAVREVLTSGLEQEGYRVLAAANGREAIAIYGKHGKHGSEISLLVTDMIMPEMGGIALGESLLAQGADVPIVYMTGYHHDLEKHRTENLPLGAGFLLKPFSPQVLAMTIRQALSTRRRMASPL